MKALFGVLVFCTVLSAACVVRGEEPALSGNLEVLDGWIGVWRFDGHWTDGRALWAEAEYRPLLDGAFLEGKVVVRDDGGAPYLRYRTIFAWDQAAECVVMHTFAADGGHSESRLIVDGARTTTRWEAGSTIVQEQMDLENGNQHLRWQVWMEGPGAEPSQMMNDVWRRVADRSVPIPSTEELAGWVAFLAPWLGGWETSDESGGDGTSWARSEYRVGVNGRFVDRSTYSLTDDGSPYHRSESVFFGGSGDDPGAVVEFANNGSIRFCRVSPMDEMGRLGFETVHEPVGNAGSRHLTLLTSADEFRRKPGDAGPVDELETETNTARWLRQGSPAHDRRAKVDATRFAGSGADVRSFVLEREMAATSAEAYSLWASDEGWSRAWASPGASRIELAIGGRYEWMFNGWLGSNGCQVLSYIPQRMLSFSWNSPPSQPETRLARTWVVVEFEQTGEGSTRVRLTHLGFGEGPQWDETLAYFQSAWRYVLDLMAQVVEAPQAGGSP